MKAKLPPHNIEAEIAVLGSLLIDPDAVVNVLDILRADHFYKQEHQVIFEAMVELFDKHQPIDAVTITDQLKKLKK